MRRTRQFTAPTNVQLRDELDPIVGAMTLNIHQAADILKIHPKSVLDLIGHGYLPAARVGRAYVMLTRDVMAYVEMNIKRQTERRLGAQYRRGSPKSVGQIASS
jgi:excisionase family DNA binding protein